jgi:hypothetical protein
MGEGPSSSKGNTRHGRMNQHQDRSYYEIKIRGCLDSTWSEWFDGLLLTADCELNETLISGEVPDQAALHGILIKVRNLGLPLIGVKRWEAGRPSG